MNIKILNREVQEFIKDNLTIDIPTFLLKKPVFEGISQQELAQQILSKKKCEKKLPTWFETPRIYYPPTLSIEQTSSELTALYKATLVQGSLIDITGGFGVDCYYFSQVCNTVTAL